MNNNELKKEGYIFQWGEQQSMISSEYWLHGYGPYIYGTPKNIDLIIYSKNEYLNAYASRTMLGEWENMSGIFLSEKKQKAYFRKCYYWRKKYQIFISNLEKIGLKGLSSKDIFSLLDKYFHIMKGIAICFPISSTEEGLQRVNEKIAKAFSKKNLLNLVPVVVTPTKKDIIFHERKDIHKLGRKKTIIKTDLENHAKEYAWLFFNNYSSQDVLRYIRERLGEKFDYQKRAKQLENLARRQKVIWRGIKNEEAKKLCQFIQRVGTERWKLKDCWSGSEYRCRPLFCEIARRIECDLHKMMMTYRLGDYERALIDNEVLTNVTINKRRKGYILRIVDGKIGFIDDAEEVDKISKSLLRGNCNIQKGKIFGQIANPGAKEGVARIIRSRDISEVMKDLKRFSKGEIIIAHQTQPNMIPLIFRAGAIVADQGGIASHAAIISREYGIPCIVGTKVASREIKDGQRIIVDANRGEVIIK